MEKNKKSKKIDWRFWKRQVEKGFVPQTTYLRTKYKEENKMSVSCPFCKEHYSSSDIKKEEREVDIKNITSILCRECGGVFVIKFHICYEPSVSYWRTSIGIWENNNDNN